MTETKDPWVFPCRLELKVVGDARADFADAVVAAIHGVLPSDYSHRSTPSSGGKYLSITVAVHFNDKAEVEAVYAALRAVSGVRIVL